MAPLTAIQLWGALLSLNCRSLWAAPSCRSMVPCPPPGRRRRSRAAHKELAAIWIARACANALCDQIQSQASRRCVAFSTRRSRPFRPASSSSCVQTLASLRPLAAFHQVCAPGGPGTAELFDRAVSALQSDGSRYYRSFSEVIAADRQLATELVQAAQRVQAALGGLYEGKREKSILLVLPR